MSKPVEGIGFEVRGLAYGRVRFSTTIKHGKGSRTVEMTCTAEEILRLADCIRGCPGVYEEPATGKKPSTMKEALADPRFRPTWIGHAVWHLEHPKALMPCLPHGSVVIDAPATPVLPASSTVLDSHDGEDSDE